MQPENLSLSIHAMRLLDKIVFSPFNLISLDRLSEITCDLNPVQPQPWLCQFLRTSSFSQAAPPE
jgi:hypothetical protein